MCTFEYKITDYICPKHTNVLNSIIMNYSYIVITIALLSSFFLLSAILYLRNVKYKKEIKVQFEEIKRLELEYQKLYSSLFLRSCSSQNKVNEMEIKELLRHKPFMDDNWNKIEEFINSTQNQFVHRLTYNYPKLTQEDIHIILLMRLHLTNKEIAVFYNIQTSSLNTKRYRLKKKMKLDNSVSIGEYINKLFTQESKCA